MMNYFTFDGVDSRDFNTFIATSNMFDAPEENVETIHIPYKNTPLHISEKTFKPFILKALCYIPDNMQNNIDELRNFLKSRFASCRYVEALRPGEFRMARFKSAFEVERSDRQTAAFVLTFECAPQRYIIDNPTISLSSTLSEETSYSLSTPAMPLPLTLEGNTTQGANPTPEAPQQIHSVKGDNEIRVTGKNLCSPFIFGVSINASNGAEGTSATSATTDFIPVDFNTNSNYYLSGLVNTLYSFVAAYNAEKQFLGRTGAGADTVRSLTSSVFTGGPPQGSGDIRYLRITEYENQSVTGTIDLLNSATIQLEVGSTPTSYEPYKAQVYPISLPVENQISTDYSALTVGSNYAQYLTIGDTVTLSLTDKDTSVDISGIYVGMFKSLADSTAGYYRVVSNGSVQAKKYTTSQYKYFTIFPNDENTWTRILARFDVQVEVGSVANHYTPYGVAPIELNALGTYKDYFYKSNGKWYLHKETKSGTITTIASVGTSSANIQYASVETIADARANGVIKADEYVTSYNASVENSIRLNSQRIVVYDNRLTDLATARSILIGMRYLYQLATPTNTEITDATLISQLNALSKAKTYDGSTTIVQVGSDAQFKLSMPVPTEISSEYFGEPIITVNEVGTIVWNDSLIKVNSAPVTINSQTLQCYYYSENKNNDVEINEFPKYEQGENYIGSTMALTVVQNYWKL